MSHWGLCLLALAAQWTALLSLAVRAVSAQPAAVGAGEGVAGGERLGLAVVGAAAGGTGQRRSASTAASDVDALTRAGTILSPAARTSGGRSWD